MVEKRRDDPPESTDWMKRLGLNYSDEEAEESTSSITPEARRRIEKAWNHHPLDPDYPDIDDD